MKVLYYSIQEGTCKFLYEDGKEVKYASCENYVGMPEFLFSSGGEEVGHHTLDALFRGAEVKKKVKKAQKNESDLESIR